MHNIRILIIEDEIKLQRLIKKYLEHANYQVFTACNGRDGIMLLDNHPIDLIILDLTLPDMNGYDIARQIRSYSDIAIVMLTARSEEEDKLKGFSVGADDYITKPFSMRELMARIKALLHRQQKLLKNDTFQFGNFIFDINSQSVLIDQKHVDFTLGELEMLYYLILNLNITLSRKQIVDHIWGYDYNGDERAVDTRIKRIRRKLEDTDLSIATIRGIGYRLEKHNGH